MTRWGELLDRKPVPPPTRYYVAERAGRLFGLLFTEGSVLEVRGEPDIDPSILREITEAEWRERIADDELRLAEMFPEAQRGQQ